MSGIKFYLRADARRRPARAAGLVLAHNHVNHDATAPLGWNGFRAFFLDPKDLGDFVPCPCGWRPDLGKHYAWKQHAKHYDTPRKRAKRYREYAAHSPWLAKVGAATNGRGPQFIREG
jgi:hypothetical protein